ncbi:MAG: rhodanese family protein [Alphaproteobacteria bacterium]|jgi:rhodanese-related sulfurtransferase
MIIQTISAREAAGLIASHDAVLVDIREADERARSHVPGSIHAPASRLGSDKLGIPPGSTVIFHCQSGNRTAQNADALAAAAPGCRVLLVEGGIGALVAAGVKLQENKRAPLPIMRQVQITAGSLVLFGAVLGALIDPRFHALSAFVGAGLVFAGIMGLCPMANLLATMPWNRRAV